MDTLGRYGADALGVASFLSDATRPGGLQAWLANRAAMGQDPSVRAYLTQHPNWSGAFGFGSSLQPTEVAPGGPNAAVRARVPNLPALPAESQVKTEQAALLHQALQHYAAGAASPAEYELIFGRPPPMTPQQMEAGTPAGMEVGTYNPSTQQGTYRTKKPIFRSVGEDATLMRYDDATGQWVPSGGGGGGGGLRGPTAASGGAGFQPPAGMHVGSIRTDKHGREMPTFTPDKAPKPMDTKQAESLAAGYVGLDEKGQPIKATPEQRTAGKRFLRAAQREKFAETRGTNAIRAETKLASITSTTQTMIETAPSVMNMVKRIRRDMAHVQVGPFAGRWQELWAGKIGENDPAFIRLRDEMGLLTTALQRMHVGARGGDRMFDHFQSLIGTGQQSPENMEAALSVIEEYAQDKLSERTSAIQSLRGPGGVPAGGAGPQPPAAPATNPQPGQEIMPGVTYDGPVQ